MTGIGVPRAAYRVTSILTKKRVRGDGRANPRPWCYFARRRDTGCHTERKGLRRRELLSSKSTVDEKRLGPSIVLVRLEKALPRKTASQEGVLSNVSS